MGNRAGSTPAPGTNRAQAQNLKGLLVKKQPFLLDFQDVIIERWIDKSGSKHIVTPYQIIFEHTSHECMLLRYVTFLIDFVKVGKIWQNSVDKLIFISDFR
ncbi:hypothetical protein [Pedobacter sp. Leaf250]|uniref:hypothetical protein n=1 Tax=Pedobacter sp. Leaf250 TaxID=2876559 RepID=UPI001E3C1714|nr:hypothetical protein [Pedobacter sp. Leaf250]